MPIVGAGYTGNIGTLVAALAGIAADAAILGAAFDIEHVLATCVCLTRTVALGMAIGAARMLHHFDRSHEGFDRFLLVALRECNKW